MEKKLEKGDGIGFVFTDSEGKELIWYIPTSKIKELGEEEAYEGLTTPECDSASCSVNNFCECGEINEDIEFSHLVVSISK